MVRLALALGVLAALLPGVAGAKEIASVTVCGASGCRTVAHTPIGLAGADNSPDRVPAVSGFYTVTFHVEHEGEDMGAWSLFWIPSSKTVAFRDEHGNTTFDRADETTAAAYREVTNGMKPFGTPSVVGATVDGQPVENPSSYLTLFGRPHDSSIYPDASDWKPVELQATQPTPWTDDVLVMVSPARRIVGVGGISFSRLEPEEATAILARDSLSTTASTTFRWVLVAGVTALLAIVLGGLVLVVRATRRERGGEVLQP